MEFYDSICSFRSREDSVIRRVCWEITTDCNLNCKFCHRFKANVQYYDYNKLPRTIQLLKNAGIKNVIMSGGEPLIQPRLFDIMYMLHKENFELDLCSNGTMINYDIAINLKKYLSEISISIDGYSHLRHDYMRNTPGCFIRTIKNVTLLIELGFDVHITTVMDISFIMEIEKMVDFLANLGVRSVSFQGLIPLNAGTNLLFETDNQKLLIEQLAIARNKFPEIAINSKQLIVEKTNSNCKCGAGNVVWGLDVNGLKLHKCLLTREREGKDVNFVSQGICNGNVYLTKIGENKD